MKRPGLGSIARAAVLASFLASCRAPSPVDTVAEPFPEAQKEVERTIVELLGTVERKDFDRLEAMHLYGPKFSKWDGKTTGRLDAEACRRAERAGIEALDAFHATVEDLKVDVFGPTAIATFVMAYEMSVKGESFRSKSWATLAWVKVDSGWKIVHEHFTAFPAKS